MTRDWITVPSIEIDGRVASGWTLHATTVVELANETGAARGRGRRRVGVMYREREPE